MSGHNRRVMDKDRGTVPGADGEMNLEKKQRRRIEQIKRSGVPILDELPEGWRLMGVYCGDYQWANNGRSRFKTGYEHALVRTEGNDGSVPC